MIVDGRGVVNGSKRAKDHTAFQRSPRPGKQLSISGTASTVMFGAGDGSAIIWLVRYNPRAIDVPIRAGENGGRTIENHNLERQLIHIGGWTGSASLFRHPAFPPGLVTAVVV